VILFLQNTDYAISLLALNSLFIAIVYQLESMDGNCN